MALTKVSLDTPEYIYLSEIGDISVRYKWHDRNADNTYNIGEDEAFIERVEGLSYRASLALTISSAEWLLFRYNKLCKVPQAEQYIEAAWAAVIDDCYLVPWQPTIEEWSGSIREPIAIGIVLIQDAVRALVFEDSQAVPLSELSNLIQYVFSNPDPFINWRDSIITRLEELYPFDPEETLGEVVPREALDPNFTFKIGQTEALVNKYLKSLNLETNPFLFNSEEMIKKKYEGQPYEFNIIEDREKRFEW